MVWIRASLLFAISVVTLCGGLQAQSLGIPAPKQTTEGELAENYEDASTAEKSELPESTTPSFTLNGIRPIEKEPFISGDNNTTHHAKESQKESVQAPDEGVGVKKKQQITLGGQTQSFDDGKSTQQTTNNDEATPNRLDTKSKQLFSASSRSSEPSPSFRKHEVNKLDKQSNEGTIDPGIKHQTLFPNVPATVPASADMSNRPSSLPRVHPSTDNSNKDMAPTPDCVNSYSCSAPSSERPKSSITQEEELLSIMDSLNQQKHHHLSEDHGIQKDGIDVAGLKGRTELALERKPRDVSIVEKGDDVILHNVKVRQRDSSPETPKSQLHDMAGNHTVVKKDGVEDKPNAKNVMDEKENVNNDIVVIVDDSPDFSNEVNNELPDLEVKPSHKDHFTSETNADENDRGKKKRESALESENKKTAPLDIENDSGGGDTDVRNDQNKGLGEHYEISVNRNTAIINVTKSNDKHTNLVLRTDTHGDIHIQRGSDHQSFKVSLLNNQGVTYPIHGRQPEQLHKTPLEPDGKFPVTPEMRAAAAEDISAKFNVKQKLAKTIYDAALNHLAKRKTGSSWSQWGPWGPCSTTCGEASTRRRTRFCVTSSQRSECEGLGVDLGHCSDLIPCPIAAEEKTELPLARKARDVSIVEKGDDVILQNVNEKKNDPGSETPGIPSHAKHGMNTAIRKDGRAFDDRTEEDGKKGNAVQDAENKEVVPLNVGKELGGDNDDKGAARNVLGGNFEILVNKNNTIINVAKNNEEQTSLVVQTDTLGDIHIQRGSDHQSFKVSLINNQGVKFPIQVGQPAEPQNGPLELDGKLSVTPETRAAAAGVTFPIRGEKPVELQNTPLELDDKLPVTPEKRAAAAEDISAKFNVKQKLAETIYDAALNYLAERKTVSTWSQWEPWGPCSTTCGEASTRRRTRFCVTSSQRSECEGLGVDLGECSDLIPCPIVPPRLPLQDTADPVAAGGEEGWSSWGSWTACGVTCGAGIRTRARVCQVDSSLRATRCPGDMHQIGNCITDTCDTSNLSPLVQVFDGEDATLSCPYDSEIPVKSLHWVVPGGKMLTKKMMSKRNRYSADGYKLIVKTARPKDSGVYHCIVVGPKRKVQTGDSSLVVVGCSNGAVCSNGGTCYDFGKLQHPTFQVQGFRCKCTDQFYGRFCEKVKTNEMGVILPSIGGTVAVLLFIALIYIGYSMWTKTNNIEHKEKRSHSAYKKMKPFVSRRHEDQHAAMENPHQLEEVFDDVEEHVYTEVHPRATYSASNISLSGEIEELPEHVYDDIHPGPGTFSSNKATMGDSGMGDSGGAMTEPLYLDLITSRRSCNLPEQLAPAFSPDSLSQRLGTVYKEQIVQSDNSSYLADILAQYDTTDGLKSQINSEAQTQETQSEGQRADLENIYMSPMPAPKPKGKGLMSNICSTNASSCLPSQDEDRYPTGGQDNNVPASKPLGTIPPLPPPPPPPNSSFSALSGILHPASTSQTNPGNSGSISPSRFGTDNIHNQGNTNQNCALRYSSDEFDGLGASHCFLKHEQGKYLVADNPCPEIDTNSSSLHQFKMGGYRDEGALDLAYLFNSDSDNSD